MQWLSRRQKAGRAVWMLSWVALLAWGSAARTSENSSSAFEGVFARDNNITEVAKLHAGAKRLMREMTTTTDEFFWQISEDIMKFSLSVPAFMWNKRPRGGDTDHGYSARQGVYNFALLSWGPGFIYYVVIAPKWTGPNCLFTHYTRRFKSNYTQNQPVWMRDALSCHTVPFLRMHNVMYIHYPDVPCPNFFYGNYMCHIIGDHVAVQPWEKWADYALYVDVLYTSYSGDRERIPYELGFGRKYYPVRIHTCDPTRDCLSFPRKNWSSIGFDFSTTSNTSTSTAAPTTKHESTTTLPPAIKTLPPIRRKSVKMVCPRQCKSRKIAEILWPIFFVTSLLVMFGVLPWIFMSAKNRTERELIRHWYRASTQSGGTTFLLRLPPKWAPGWPPGPSTGRRSRTDREGRWRSGTGPPPFKRRRLS